MKTSRLFLIAALFGAIAAHAETTPEDCPDGSCALPAWLTGETNAPAAPALVVLSPVPESAVEPIAPAPRRTASWRAARRSSCRCCSRSSRR